METFNHVLKSCHFKVTQWNQSLYYLRDVFMPRLLISHFESELIIGLHKPDNQSDVKDGPPLEMVCRVLLNGIPVSSPHAGALNSDSPFISWIVLPKRHRELLITLRLMICYFLLYFISLSLCIIC